ncbi:helix-turn-helix domain-containing protein [Stenotrophomonas sp. PD6]|uniref:helix-turn-helix domain-containing protein n=1 Tax=Stenotrophomonas sp. PD6 TaxID=3368612 RepID=UPI003BA1E702
MLAGWRPAITLATEVSESNSVHRRKESLSGKQYLLNRERGRYMQAMCDRIRRARLTAGLSQSQLALEAGVRRSAVAQWEREGGTFPSVQHLACVAIVTQVYFEWLATGRGPGRPEDGNDLTLSEETSVDAARTAQETEILSLLRRMPPRKRQMARAIIEMLND